MRVAFVSNYLTHHQLPFCHAMNARLGNKFCFIETERMSQNRINMGWQLEEAKDIHVIKSYMDNSAYRLAVRKINEADAVIIGGTKDEYIKQRLKENKLIFRYEERIFKKSWLKIFDPRILHMIYATHIKNQGKKVYMLCASAYLSQELKIFHLYKNKMFQWGYFPETYYYDIDELMEKKRHDVVEILWCARFISWKHPEKAVMVAKELVQQGVKFHITMIGDGELRLSIEKKVLQEKLDKYISFLGAIPAKEVRNYMEKANIFLATSDRNEGWGAVINEAMNSGCAVVADKMMGAVPFLIENKENGYAYRNDKECQAFLEMLIQDEVKRRKVGVCAYKTITEKWNAEKAAESLLKRVIKILKKENMDVSIEGSGSAIL